MVVGEFVQLLYRYCPITCSQKIFLLTAFVLLLYSLLMKG